MNYTQLLIHCSDASRKEMALAYLQVLDFTGFEEQGNQLFAFASEAYFSTIETTVLQFLQDHAFSYEISYLEDQNWNALWESNFDPVVVGDFCAIRAQFHAPIAQVKHDILVTPKMSFGTGHHATTYLMIEAMASLALADKTVFDFGTGTGVLAILADKMDAQTVLAVDNDSWSLENAAENIASNHCTRIQLLEMEAFPLDSKFDVILANINRHVLLAQMNVMSEGLAKDGVLLMSGLLSSDAAIIEEAAVQAKLERVMLQEKDSWICLQYRLKTQD
jgi:ribosomal protein L11 methyltransferase